MRDYEGATDRSPRSTERTAGSVGTFDRLPLPHLVLGPAGTIEWANEAWLSLVDGGRSGVKGRRFAEFLSAGSAAAFEDSFAPGAEGAGIDGVEIQLAAGPAEGTPFALSARVGQDDVVHCQLSEISDYRERAARLERQNAKIEALHDVAMSIEEATEEQAIFETVVAAAEEVLDFDVAIADGVDGDELVTRAVSEGVDSEAYLDRVPIDDESKLGTTVYREGVTKVVDDLAAAGWVDTSSPFRSALTVPIGEHGVFQAVNRKSDAFDEMDRDLAELLVAHGRNALSGLETMETLKRRTRSLGRERNRLAAIFEAVPEPIAHVRYEAGEPLVEAVNSAFEVTFGYEGHEIEGRSINDVIVPAERLAEARKLDRQASESGVAEQEVTRQTVDGERTFRLRSSALETGGDPEALAIYVDLTEQKERERELEWENERLEQFASIVSHDLRSPLTVAKGRLDLMEDGEHVAAVSRAIDRMDAIIEDVLTLTRDGQTVTPEETEPVALGQLAVGAWESVDAETAELVVETEQSIVADRSRLRRVLQNLFRNAIEHAGPSVTVTVGDTGDGFFVADDGPGIPPDRHEKIFESGFTTAEDGTGLGLEIVEELVQAHGWSVSVGESGAGGARFDVATN